MICVWSLTPPRQSAFARALAAGLAFALIAARTPATADALPSPPPPPRVLTTFLPVFCLTTAIAGERARVENWLPPGVDPHEFQFQPRDLRRLREAGFLVVSGLGLEPWPEARLRAAAGNPNLRVVEAAAGLPADAVIVESDRHDHGPAAGNEATPATRVGTNPHYWHDPLLVAHAVTNVLNALSAADPEGRAIYRRNADALLTRLGRLHQDFVAALEPVRTSAFITYHNAFPYLARRYGLRLVGVVENNAAEEPSARELADLAVIVRREKVRVLFIDGQPTRLARRLAADFGVKLVTLDPLEIGPLEGGAWEAGMRRNLAALTAALSPGSDR